MGSSDWNLRPGQVEGEGDHLETLPTARQPNGGTGHGLESPARMATSAATGGAGGRYSRYRPWTRDGESRRSNQRYGREPEEYGLCTEARWSRPYPYGGPTSARSGVMNPYRRHTAIGSGRWSTSHSSYPRDSGTRSGSRRWASSWDVVDFPRESYEPQVPRPRFQANYSYARRPSYSQGPRSYGICPTTPERVIWLCRHGNRQDFVDTTWKETAENPSDPPLSIDGFEDAKALGRRLKGVGISHIFASPFLRTVQTAHHIAESLGVAMKLEMGLQEHNNPKWWKVRPEPMDPYSLNDLYDTVDTSHKGTSVWIPYPESYKELYPRVKEAFNAIIQKSRGDIVIVTHGAVVNSLTTMMTRRPVTFQCATGAIVKLVANREGYYTALLENDTSHLTHSTAALNTRLN